MQNVADISGVLSPVASFCIRYMESVPIQNAAGTRGAHYSMA